MKKNLLGVLFVVAVFFSSHAQNVRVLGYFPQYRGTNGVQYDKLTDIAYSFINPNSNGSLKTNGYSGDRVFGFDMTKFTTIKDGCANAGTNLWIALGGADDAHARDNRLNSVSGNATYRNRLAEDLVDFCITHGIYGISVDWEFPDPGTQVNNHVLLLEAIDSEINSSSNPNIKVSVAVGGETKGTVNHMAYIHTDLFNSKEDLVDEWHVMAYDFPNTSSYNVNHSSLKDAEDCMEGWELKGMDYSEMLLGVPFYGRNSNRSGEIEYNNLTGSASTNYDSDVSGQWYYNGKSTLEAKIDLAVEKGALGILIWDIGQDKAEGNYSLLDAIDDKVNQVCPISKPNLGPDKGVCAPNTVTLDPNVTGSGLTFTWTKDGGSSIGTSTTLEVSEAGTYKVSISNGNCTKEDEIVIVSGSSVTTTSASGCNDENLTLSVNSPVSGKSYQWYDEEAAGNLLFTGSDYTATFSENTTVFVEEVSDGVDTYSSSVAGLEGEQIFAWAGGTYTFRCGQMLEVEKDLTLKSLRLMASKLNGITFNVKIVDASNAPNYVDVANVGPFTAPSDGSAQSWSYLPFDFDVDVELPVGLYILYVEPSSGDEGNYGVILNHVKEDSESGVYTLKESTFQASLLEESGYPNFGVQYPPESSNGDGGAYGPFLSWKLETGANASCGRTSATASVVSCAPPVISITSPTSNSNWYTNNTINFEADITDESAVTSVTFEVYKGGSLVATVPTIKDGSTYTANWTPTESGDDYTLKVSATDDNSNESNEEVDFNVDFNVSVNEIISGNSVNVYPSPASDNFNVSFELTSNNNVDIFILNSVGSIVKSKNLSNISGAQSINFNASELANGLYFIKLKSGDKMITKTVNVSK
jgi:GH18 family chitinase